MVGIYPYSLIRSNAVRFAGIWNSGICYLGMCQLRKRWVIDCVYVKHCPFFFEDSLKPHESVLSCFVGTTCSRRYE